MHNNLKSTSQTCRSTNLGHLSKSHFQKPRLHMAHFKRTRPGTEPGSVPGPVTRLFTLSGPGTAPTQSSTWPPSICAMQCLCSLLFLDFDGGTELWWPVCCDHETFIYFICPISEFSAPFSRPTLAAVRGHYCVFVYAYSEKNKLKN